MILDSLEPVRIGGMTQWIRVRATDRSHPVLLLMQQGPGLPIINEVRIFERLLGLESHFTVVYWDQRGTGRSALPLRKGGNRFEISAAAMVDDAVSLLELLHTRFGNKIFVAGFSFGATFATQAAVRRPDLVAAVVATAMDIDVAAAEHHMYDFVLSRARQDGNRRAIRQLEGIGPPPHLTAKQFRTRARWVADYGGVIAGKDNAGMLRMVMGSLIRSSDYSVAGVARAVRGITASQAALLPELAATDLVSTVSSMEVPVVLAQGRLDQVAPGEAAQRFYDSVTAPSKRLVWFERSAHTPQFDEPDKFRRLLLEVKDAYSVNA
jgi:pimeloyl-ACP methyl ester carboxylesterase